MIATLAELESVRDDCRRLVHRRALTAAATSAVPLPGVDVAADIGLLATLLPKISERFGLSEDQVAKLPPHLAQQALVIAAGMGNGVIGRAISKRIVGMMLRRVARRLAVGSAARFVPFAGTALAAGLGYAAMRSVGLAHVEDCYATARSLIVGTGGGDPT